MADEALRDILENIRERVQAELDAQLQALGTRFDEAAARMRQDIEAEVEKRWAARVETVRSEWSARLQSEILTTRAEAEERLAAEAMRLKAEADQALEAERRQAAAQFDDERRRADLELQHAQAAFDVERRQAAAQLDNERRRAELELQHAQAAFEIERQQAAAQLEDERRRAEHELQQTLAALDVEREQIDQDEQQQAAHGRALPSKMLDAIRAIDGSRSLSEALASLVRGAAAHAPRVALFVVNGARLEEWSVTGVVPSQDPIFVAEGGLLRAAITRGEQVASASGDPERTPPPFAALPPDRQALAVPLMVGGQAVAVLYADEGVTPAATNGHSWSESVEFLASHAAASLTRLTAVRSLQVLQGGNVVERVEVPAPDEEQSARRYAKLLVSEIKLYNEGAVRVGRQRRDLRQRLRAEIERARRLYEERVPASVSGRSGFFDEELVQTLAGGEPESLGA